MKKILIVAGEPSGDLHASNLVKELKKLETDLRFFGIGGTLSKDAGVEVLFDISKLALVGMVEVLKNMAVVNKAYKKALMAIDAEKPDLAILVDYPGFNLRLAGELKKRSIPVLYYISPQVWAWGEKRIKIIKRCVKKIVVFFGFEEELYRAKNIDVEFVGHPLLDTVKTTLSKNEVLKKYGLSKEKRTIALLAGSRPQEVRALLPVMACAAKGIKKKLGDVQFIVSKHPDLPITLYKEHLKYPDLTIVEADTYNILGASDLAIVASGTATLETAIVGTPLIIVYKVSLLTFILAKLVMTTPFLGLVNLIAGKEIAPELLQFDANPEKIATKTIEILGNKNRLDGMREELRRVKESLGAPGASERAARAILPLLQ